MSDENLDYLNEFQLYLSRLNSVQNTVNNQEKDDEMSTVSFYLGYDQETSSAIVGQSEGSTVKPIATGTNNAPFYPSQPILGRNKIIPPQRKSNTVKKPQPKSPELFYNTGILFKTSHQSKQLVQCINPTYSFENGKAIQKCDGTGEYVTYQELKNKHYTYKFAKSVKGYKANRIDKKTTELNAIYDWYFDDAVPPSVGDDIDNLPKTYSYVFNGISSFGAAWGAYYGDPNIKPGKAPGNPDVYPRCDLTIHNANALGYSIYDNGTTFGKRFDGEKFQFYSILSAGATDSAPEFSSELLSLYELVCGITHYSENRTGDVNFPVIEDKDNLIADRNNLISQINNSTNPGEINNYLRQLQQIEQQFNPAPPRPRIIYPEEVKPSQIINVYYLQNEKKLFKLAEYSESEPVETYITSLKKGLTAILKIGKIQTNSGMKWAKVVIFDQGVISTYTHQDYPEDKLKNKLEKDWQKEWAYLILVKDFPQSTDEQINKFVLGNNNENETIKNNKLYKYANLTKAKKIIYCDLQQQINKKTLKELLVTQKVKKVVVNIALPKQNFLDAKIKKIKVDLPQLKELDSKGNIQQIVDKTSVTIYNISIYSENI